MHTPSYSDSTYSERFYLAHRGAKRCEEPRSEREKSRRGKGGGSSNNFRASTSLVVGAIVASANAAAAAAGSVAWIEFVARWGGTSRITLAGMHMRLNDAFDLILGRRWMGRGAAIGTWRRKQQKTTSPSGATMAAVTVQQHSILPTPERFTGSVGEFGSRRSN